MNLIIVRQIKGNLNNSDPVPDPELSVSAVVSDKSESEFGLNESDIDSEDDSEHIINNVTYYNENDIANFYTETESAFKNYLKFKIIKTNKGIPKLNNEGYFCTIENRTSSKVIWKCERIGKKTTSKCNGIIATDLKVASSADIRKNHNHLPEPEKLNTIESVQEMISRAKMIKQG